MRRLLSTCLLVGLVTASCQKKQSSAPSVSPAVDEGSTRANASAPPASAPSGEARTSEAQMPTDRVIRPGDGVGDLKFGMTVEQMRAQFALRDGRVVHMTFKMQARRP